MGNSKIVYYGETLIDLTGDTVEAAKLLKGITAHDKKGEKITGTFEAVDPYAIISVTYPEGSVCTCSNGSITLTAKDTSGKALFVIPEAGTWTVKAVKGSQSASKAVSITAEGQVATVVLAYELILFDGTDNTDVTGGLKLQVGKISEGGSVVSAPISGGKIKYNKTGYIGIYPTKKADISSYSTLYVDLDLAGTILQETHVAGVIKSNLTPAQAIDSESTSSFLAYKALEEGKNSLAIPVDNLSGDRQFLLTYYTPYSEEVSISNIRFV